MSRPSVYERIKQGLAIAAQTILAAPVKLPAKVVAAAKYVALAIGLLDALDGEASGQKADSKREEPDE